MKLEVRYYGNGRGGTAISVDGGEYVVISNGRSLYLPDTAWEEADEEDCSPLSEDQKAAILLAQAELDGMSEAEMERHEMVLTYRKRRIATSKKDQIRAAEKPNRVLDPSVMIEYANILED